MIQHSDQNHVSENTSTTETVHICEVLGAEVSVPRASREARRTESSARQTSPKDRYLELQAEIKLLRQEITILSQKNETLHNCWQSAIANHIESESQARAWISRAAFKDSELAEARRQIEELNGILGRNPSAPKMPQEHLNPKEVNKS